MSDSGASEKKPIKEIEKLRARKAKLERLSHFITKGKKEGSVLKGVGASVDRSRRKTGIDILGNIAWGRHFCVFYQSKQDLIDILVPYVKAGLENNEFCMWITSEPLNAQEAKKSLKQAVNNIDSYIKKGQIEILDYSQGYTKLGKFEADRVLQEWIQKHDEAIRRGFDGLRLTGNTFWLEKKDWREFTKYEARVNNAIRKYRMLAICTYSLDNCGANEVLDVVNNHQFAAVKREGIWELLESAERRKMGEALQASEHRYRDLFENAGEGIITLDLDGRITGANRLVEEYGFNRDELLGRKLFEFVPEYDKAKSVSDFQALLAGSRVRGEMDVITPKGIISVEYRDTPIVRAGGIVGVQAILTDITERKRAEEALRLSEDKFRSIFDNANDIIASLTKTGKILEVNKKIEDILGYKPDELIGKNFMTLGILAAKNAARMVHIFKESVKIGGFLVSRNGRNVTEVWVNHKDGHTVLLEANTTTIKEDGKLVGYLSVVRDITERKRAEEAYRSLVDHSLQGLAIFQNGRVVFANQAMADMTGFTVDEMLASPPEQVQAFVHPDDRELVWSRHRARLNGEELPERYEFRGIRRNGSTCWLELHASLIEYQGRPAIQAAYVDITERKKAEEAVKESEEKFKSIFEHANDGVIYLDTSGNILDINERAAKMFGGPKQQAVNKHFTEVGVFSADEIPTLMSNFEKIFASEEVVLTVPIKNKKGPELILECSASIAKTDDGAGRILVIARDITERKKAEEQIEKLAKFPAEDPYPVLRISGHGTVIYGNKAGSPVLKCWGCRVGESLPDCWQGLVLDALSSGQSQRTEAQCDGRIFSLTFAPVVDANYVNIYGHDITERKKGEEALRKSEEKWRSLVENAPNLIIIAERDGTIQFINYTASGFKIEETIGTKVYNYVEPEYRDTLRKVIESVFQTGEHDRCEIKGAGPKGKTSWYDTQVGAIKYNGQVVSVTLIVTDITERKKTEEKLIEYQAKLKAMASKMLITQERERQSLAMGLHDEVCQKLVLTKLALESSLSLVSDSNVLASLKIVCAGIGETIEKANSLTFELSNPVLRQLGFIIALEKYLTEEIQQKYGIAYELESDQQLGTMQDEIKNCLFRVTRELLTNVVKHAHARKVKVSIHESRGRIYVGVQDDGVGFKESQAGSTVSKTTRFGLFSVREQLEYLGGHLEIESEPGQGTTATIVIPQIKKAIV